MAFQPTIRNILKGKVCAEYHEHIQLVEKLTRQDCGWPLQHCYDMVTEFILFGHIIFYLSCRESDVKSTAMVCIT